MELLVVVAVIAILVGLIAPALAKARTAARQTRELSTAQQLIRAYLVYSNDHRGMLLPGYTPTGWTATDDQGATITGQAARRYPWRIAPYLDYNFAGLYDDRNLLDRYRGRSDYQYVVSLSPSLGINADFVGGNDENGLAFRDAGTQLYGAWYLTKLDQATRPTGVLVFAGARGVDPDGGTTSGFHRIEAPNLMIPRWSAAPFDPSGSPESWGYVHPRYEGRATTVFLDGHGDALRLDALRDLRMWADQATGPDWVLRPKPNPQTMPGDH